jgi:N-acetylglucosamine-6-phosphate deacetylase
MPSPRYIDVQVNGYAGTDFNTETLTTEALHHACRQLAADGVAAFLPTVITAPPDRMAARLRRLATLRAQDPLAHRMIAGLHVEGPFISPVAGYCGAHPPASIRPADPELMRRLLEAGAGLVRLVTLAPEQDPGLKTTRLLVRRGIVVSAGHTNASLDQLKAATDAGLTMFTHLGNGCPIQMPRHDNIIQRALSLRDRLWLTFIADGVHVPLFALGNLIRAAGLDRCIVTTDAMAAAGMGPGRFRIGELDVLVGKDLAAWAPDRSFLMGSAMPLSRTVANLSRGLGLAPAAIARLLRTNPRRALGLGRG